MNTPITKYITVFPETLSSITFRPQMYYLAHTVRKESDSEHGVIAEHERMVAWLAERNLQANIDYQFSETCAGFSRMGSYSDPADGVVMIPTRLRFADVETELAFRIRFGCEPGSGGFT